MISWDRDKPARRTWDEVKASVETENLSIDFKELDVRRKERPARARGGEIWASGVEKDSGSMDEDNWYECHKPSEAIFLISDLTAEEET